MIRRMRRPVLFISHGAPSIALEQGAFARDVGAYGATLADARALVVISAHWQTRAGVAVNAVAHPEPIYDFGGFAPELYTIRYDAPGDPALAGEIVALLSAAHIPARFERERGWDHGLWVPIRHLLPEATLPIVEVSLPLPTTPDDLLQIGAALAPLRERNVAIAGSGGIVHNLRRLRFDDVDAPVEAWAAEFDRWVMDRIEARDYRAVADYRTRAPHAEWAAPTPEHFEPLLAVLGAASADDRLVPIHGGFQYATLSMRTFALEG